jgi:hypothetical protein
MSAPTRFPPVEALRTIARVCSEKALTPAQRLAVIRVVLYAANDTGLAWASYRAITKETGLAPATIRAALRFAEGRYLLWAGVGRQGAVQYRIALQSVKRSTGESTSQAEALALHSAPESASQAEAKLTPITNPKTDPKRRAADKPPPDPRVNTFLDSFCKSYAEVLGRPYIVQDGKDGKLVKRLLKSLDGNGSADAPAELQRAAGNMLADSWGRERASIGLLVSQINTWRGGPTQRQTTRASKFTPAETSGTDYDALTRRL